MPIYVSGSAGGCESTLSGTLAGPIINALTSSFKNADYGTAVCSGTMLVHTYTNAAPSETAEALGQKLFIWLSGSSGSGDGCEWVFITGSTGCVDPV
jgi:hypothetical protein